MGGEELEFRAVSFLLHTAALHSLYVCALFLNMGNMTVGVLFFYSNSLSPTKKMSYSPSSRIYNHKKGV